MIMRHILALLWLVVPTVCLAADDGPWPFPKLRHRRHFVVEPVEGASDQTGVVGFSTGNVIDGERPDVRVIAEGKRVACRVLRTGPGSVCRLAFQVNPLVEDYFVFYGPAPAEPQAAAWKPEAGLILETRRFNGGQLKDLNGLRKVIRRSGPSFGSDVVSRVFHGHNPFGPSDNYVS